MRARRIAFQVRRAAEQDRSHREAILNEPSSRDEAVTAVVALARDDEDVRDGSGKALDQRIGDRFARARHQRVRRDAVLVLADAIKFAALAGIEQNHRDRL